MTPYYETELGKLYHGDCLEIMPGLESVDLVLTDPPYGIGCARAIHCTKPSRPSTYLMQKKYEDEKWDIRPPDRIFHIMQTKSKNQIIWGGNYFTEALPESRCWLYWDKMFENTTNFSHGELAWTSFKFGIKQIRISSKSETNGGKNRVHPTQKPKRLIIWCLSVSDQAEHHATILDPYLGSGTTAIACERLKRKWIGIEIEEKYCEIAAKRIEQERKQLKLF